MRRLGTDFFRDLAAERRRAEREGSIFQMLTNVVKDANKNASQAPEPVAAVIRKQVEALLTFPERPDIYMPVIKHTNLPLKGEGA